MSRWIAPRDTFGNRARRKVSSRSCGNDCSRTTVDSEIPGAGYELTEILGTIGLGLGSGTGTWY